MKTETATIEAVEGIRVQADVTRPDRASATVVFAHGSGSSRHSPRNRQVAATLQEAGLETVLLDLLTADEEREDMRTGEHRFDIPLLARRVVGALDWADSRTDAEPLPVGLFGASTGAAAALVAAAHRRRTVGAVVSRGGRPDLAGEALASVMSPTLLIVGGDDHAVIELNRQAQAQMTGKVEFKIVPGAGHLFEEPGSLETVAELARDWFLENLAR